MHRCRECIHWNTRDACAIFAKCKNERSKHYKTKRLDLTPMCDDGEHYDQYNQTTLELAEKE